MPATLTNPHPATDALTSLPDLALLRRYCDERDESAFAEIVRRYAGVVYAACRRVLRDRAAAEDVAQETFLRLVRQPDGCSQSLGGWLHRSATRLAIDALRSDAARRRREAEHGADADDGPVVAPSSSSRRADADAPPTWRELSPYVDAALDELPEAQRDLLVAHFLRGRSQVDLAAEGGTSPATMSRRMRQAVDALRRTLARRGVALSAAALVALVAQHAAEAAPAAVVHELGKMAMVSGGSGGSGGGWPAGAAGAVKAGTPVAARVTDAVHAAGSAAGAAAGPAVRALLAYAAAVGAVTLVALTTARWLGFDKPEPPAPAPRVEPESSPATRTARADGFVVLSDGRDLDSRKVRAFQRTGGGGGTAVAGEQGTIAVVYNDNHTVTLPAGEARRIIEAQAGVTLEQLAARKP